MMIYYEFIVSGPVENELIIGLLSAWPFESYMELEHGVAGYFPSGDYSTALKDEIELALKPYDLTVLVNTIQPQNWNETWESNFQPVIIDDFCLIRADFHRIDVKAQHTITINPKMAFGTGHHETTWMMIKAMRDIRFQGKQVFDYGTGTGILAILAKQLGADTVFGIDYDINAIENAFENALSNDVEGIKFSRAELTEIPIHKYDVVLANINVPVLVEQSERLTNFVIDGGILLLSGILKDKADQIINIYEPPGFVLTDHFTKGNWSCLKFHKKMIGER